MRPVVLAVDTLTANHLVKALSSHAGWCRVNGTALPPVLRALLDELSANDGQRRPRVVDAVDGGDGEFVLMVDYAAAGRRLGGVSERTVRRLVAEGQLRAVSVGQLRRIRVADLVEFVEGL